MLTPRQTATVTSEDERRVTRALKNGQSTGPCLDQESKICHTTRSTGHETQSRPGVWNPIAIRGLWLERLLGNDYHPTQLYNLWASVTAFFVCFLIINKDYHYDDCWLYKTYAGYTLTLLSLTLLRGYQDGCWLYKPTTLGVHWCFSHWRRPTVSHQNSGHHSCKKRSTQLHDAKKMCK